MKSLRVEERQEAGTRRGRLRTKIASSTRLLSGNNALLRLAASLFVLELGSGMTIVGLPLLIVKDYGLGLDTGVVLGLRLLPNILFGAAVGGIVDRFDPRKVAALSAVASAIVVALFPLSMALWQVQALSFLVGITYLFGLPARMALLPRVIEPGTEVAGNSLIVSASRLAQLLGPALAGPVVALAGVNWLFDVEALTGVAAALLMLGLSLRASPDGGEAGHEEAGHEEAELAEAELAETGLEETTSGPGEGTPEGISGGSPQPKRAPAAGRRVTDRVRTALRLTLRPFAGPGRLLRIVRLDPVVTALTVTSFTYVFAVGLGRIFLIRFASCDLPGTSGAYAYLLAAMGLGATVGGLAATRLQRFHQGWIYLLGNLLEGACWLAMPLVSVLWLALLLMVVAGLFESVATVVYFAEVQIRLPAEYMGRYFAILVPLTDIFSAGGSTFGAPIVSHFSLPASAAVTCLLIAVPVIVVARRFTWKKDRPESPCPA